MQSGNGNTQTMGDYLPDQADQRSSSAFPRLSTSPLIQEAIENGEINKSDIDLLEKAQRLSGMGQSLGFLLGSVGGFLAVRRLRPQAKFGQRLGGFFFGGMFGSFVGFISGSVAGAMDVKSKMPDANRKLAKIAEITQKARDMKREEMLQRQKGLPPPAPGTTGQTQIPRSFPPRSQPGQRPYPDSSASPSSPYYPRPASDSSWTGSTYTASEEAENRREQAGEMDRQKNYSAEMKQIERDSQMALSSPYDRDPAPSDSGYDQSQGSNPPIGRPQAGRPPGSAWDRLRQRDTQGPSGPRAQVDGSYGGGAGSGGGGRSKEQREFDEMLERERRGEGETGNWK